MSDLSESFADPADGADAAASRLNTAVAVLVALTATFTAVCNIKDGNIVQAMQKAQAAAVDTWAYYQAKGTKENLAEAMADQFRLERDMQPGLGPQALALIERKIAEYEGNARRYAAEKEDIKQQAKAFEQEYDRLNVHDDQFDMAEASMSVAIALFGVTALTRKRWLLGVASVLASFGALLGLAGFFGWRFRPDFLARLLG